MKKFLLTFSAILLFSFLAKAGNNDLFRYDRNKVDQALSNATQVENLVAEDPSLTWNDLNNAGNRVISTIEPTASPFGTAGEPPLGIPSFLWGCVLGWVGLLIVGLTIKDKAETTKALLGCLIWTGVVIAGVYLMVQDIANTSNSTANGCGDILHYIFYSY